VRPRAGTPFAKGAPLGAQIKAAASGFNFTQVAACLFEQVR
jgi:hypothetical protein